MEKNNKNEISTKKAPSSLKNTLDGIDPRLGRVFLSWAKNHPRYLQSFISLASAYIKSERARKEELVNGVRVPPFLILSITSRCNLHCAGCFAAQTGTIFNENRDESRKQRKISLDLDEWRAIITEASELGIFGFVIAGGEPFLFPGLIGLCEEFKDRFFLILTNGTAISEADYKLLKQLGNVMIIVSVEGGLDLTNSRRGHGVFEQAMKTLKDLEKIGVLTGISVTITRMNFKYWMNVKNIDYFIEQGIRLLAFIEYIPLTPSISPESRSQEQTVPSYTCTPESMNNSNDWSLKNDHELMLNSEERARFRSQILNYRATKNIYLVHSPGDEEYFGGCVSAGRGFAHVTPTGDLTPCPVSNIATHNLTKEKLRDGLLSPLFRKICENEHLLETDGMPCALFAHPKEVDELARSVGAYRTDIRQG